MKWHINDDIIKWILYQIKKKNNKIWWRNHEDNPSWHPSKKQAQEAFNTLIGWCIGQWLKEWEYSNLGLLIRIRKYINKLDNFN